MGYMAHHALIVYISGYIVERRCPTADQPMMPDIAAFRETLPEQFRQLLIGPVQTAANDDYVVAFMPDGSKEGWGTSDEGDRIRARLIEMFSFHYDDRSSPFDIVEVRFGGDEPDLVSARDPGPTHSGAEQGAEA